MPLKMADSTDIRMKGMLVKMKTMKKKLFVLREESACSAARLEYYDSEKKFAMNARPKRSIHIKTCFSINKGSDPKHKYSIALYTKDDCFTIVLNTEEEQRAWLSEMIYLRNQPGSGEGSTRPLFEHIWLVTVKPKGLGNGKCINPGQYRLCLTNKTLGLVRLNHEEPDIRVQLESIRRCGHSDCFFFMELGRSALTGAGEIWMQVEDPVISQNMHEAILSSMKSNSAAEQIPNFRQRSHSSITKSSHKPSASNSSLSRGKSPLFDSNTLPIRPKTMSVSLSENPRSVLELGTSPQRNRDSQLSSKPVSSSASSSSLRPFSSSLSQGHSPVGSSPLSYSLSHEAHRSRTDSMESRGSRGSRGTASSCDEIDLSPIDRHSGGGSSTRSVTPEGSIQEGTSYMAMSSGSRDSCLASMSPPVVEGYMEMGCDNNKSLSGNTQTGAEYMDMSPGEPSFFDTSRGSSSTSSAISSTSGSGQIMEDSNYFDMAPVSQSLSPVQERYSDAGYIEMTPQNVKTTMRLPSQSLRPDKVFSYLSEEPSEEFPKRAYSVGSRAAIIQNKPLNESYMDMSKGKGSVEKVNPKSSSAPHLTEKNKSGAQAAKLGNEAHSDPKNKADLLMEMDFHKDIRPRTSSGSFSSDFRPRVSSGGYERRLTARDKLSKFVHIAKHRGLDTGEHSSTEGHRPRTATICQDSLRPRTSSFSSADMRPRSSSYGNNRFRELLASKSESPRTDAHHQSLSDSLQHKHQRHSSQDSMSSANSDYLDMTPKMSSSPSQALTDVFRKSFKKSLLSQPCDEYVAMDTTTTRPEEGMEKKSRTPERSLSKSKSKRKSSLKGPPGSITVKVSSGYSSSESLQSSSSAHSSDSRSKAQLDSSGGEYIEMDYSRSPGTSSKNVPASDKSKSKKTVEVFDAYVSYSPLHSREVSPARPEVGLGLDKVISPIRSDHLQPPSFKPPQPPSVATQHSGDNKKKTEKTLDYINVGFNRQEKPKPVATSTPDSVRSNEHASTKPPYGSKQARGEDSGYMGMEFTKREKKKSMAESDKSDYMGMDFTSKSSSKSSSRKQFKENSPSSSSSSFESKEKTVKASSSKKSMPPPFKPLPPRAALELVQPTPTENTSVPVKIPPNRGLASGGFSAKSLTPFSTGPNCDSGISITDQSYTDPGAPVSKDSSTCLGIVEASSTVCGQGSSKSPELEHAGSSHSLTRYVGAVLEEASLSTSNGSQYGSCNNVKELNYATLDLASSTDDFSNLPASLTGSEKAMKGRHSSGEGEEPPLQYAEIDFSRREESRQKQDLPAALLDSSTFPFELK